MSDPYRRLTSGIHKPDVPYGWRRPYKPKVDWLSVSFVLIVAAACIGVFIMAFVLDA